MENLRSDSSKSFGGKSKEDLERIAEKNCEALLQKDVLLQENAEKLETVEKQVWRGCFTILKLWPISAILKKIYSSFTKFEHFAIVVLLPYSKSKFELESNLSEILPINCKFFHCLTPA